MTGRPAAQRAADLLIRTACRRLPGHVRDDHYREWSAEFQAILHDPGIRVAALRRARALRYAAGVHRSASRLYPSARPARRVAAAGGWVSRSERRPLRRPKLAGGILPAIAAVITWAVALLLLNAFPPHGGADYPALATGITAEILAVIAVARYVRWRRRRNHPRPR